MTETVLYTAFGASRSQVDRAGKRLRDYMRTPGAELGMPEMEAVDLLWAFRAEFQPPLTKVVMGLRSFVRSEGAPVVVGQRLKRMPQIVMKLARQPTMALTRMQDIGGCRAILPSRDYFPGVQRRIHRNWRVVETYDYIGHPKDSGYRAIHVVVLRDNRLIEIQLRTQRQHEWAEAVERTAILTHHDVKNGTGPEVLLRYLEQAAYAIDLDEQGLPHPDGFDEAFAELRESVRPYYGRR